MARALPNFFTYPDCLSRRAVMEHGYWPYKQVYTFQERYEAFPILTCLHISAGVRFLLLKLFYSPLDFHQGFSKDGLGFGSRQCAWVICLHDQLFPSWVENGIFGGNLNLTSNAWNLLSACKFRSNGSAITELIPISRCLYARSSQLNAASISPR